MSQPSSRKVALPSNLRIRLLSEADLDHADRIERLAFGTFGGLADPLSWMGDGDHVHGRWRASPDTAYAAELDGKLVGSNFVTRWGSFASFGPLTIDPSHWGEGFAKHLIAPAVELFDAWGVAHTGIFTFAQSVKHIALYQQFGFRPRALTLILEKPVGAAASNTAWSAYSSLDDSERRAALASCHTLTDDIYPGLDATPEIESIASQSLGDTVLIADGAAGFAACHTGPGSEGGSGRCFVKFAASPSLDGEHSFGLLLDACEAFAAERDAQWLVAGVSAARQEAYELMLRREFRFVRTGLAMHRPNESAFSRPGVFVLDDWR